jgi:hypothetical protein
MHGELHCVTYLTTNRAMVLGGGSGDGGVASSSCLCPRSPHLSSHPNSPPGTPCPSVHSPAPTIAILLAASHCTKHRSVAGGCGRVGWMRTMGSCRDLALPSQLPSAMPATPRVQTAGLPAQAASSWALVSTAASRLRITRRSRRSRAHTTSSQNAPTSTVELLAAPGLHAEWNSAASSTQHIRQTEISVRPHSTLRHNKSMDTKT